MFFVSVWFLLVLNLILNVEKKLSTLIDESSHFYWKMFTHEFYTMNLNYIHIFFITEVYHSYSLNMNLSTYICIYRVSAVTII